MTIRRELELREHDILSPYASFSDQSKGRPKDEEQCDIRPVFQRDRDRILHSKSFRRLKNKTQVFLSPLGDHYRTRLSHTLEVSQNARTIAKALRLNEDLVEAIALGHDIGHTPFGHAGERVLNKLCENGFRHNEQSVRQAQFLEKDGEGLNLTWEVTDGMLNHQTNGKPATLEGKIVRFSDKIAYINHDIDDGIRAGLMKEEDIPFEIRAILGQTTKDRLDKLIHNIIINSMDKDDILMSIDVWEAMQDLRKYMFEHLYTNSVAKAEEAKAMDLVAKLYDFYKENPDEMTGQYIGMLKEGESLDRVVCDYIAGMTDQYAISRFKKYFVPVEWHTE